ncbi:hypothetical protein DICSQDRAFT_130574, partial [Dichomitus squalens LYAD-421 SS1]
HGHTALYLDHTKVTKYVALEPNVLMHPEIRTTAAKKGFTEEAGTLLILPYGAEQISLIASALGGAHAVDTLVSILSLCSIPDPEQTLRRLVNDALKPGGTLLFYEHVLSPREDVARWQRFWAPVWVYIMDGCRIDRPTHVWIEKIDAWAEGSVWGKEGEPEEHLFWHRVGRYMFGSSVTCFSSEVKAGTCDSSSGDRILTSSIGFLWYFGAQELLPESREATVGCCSLGSCGLDDSSHPHYLPGRVAHTMLFHPAAGRMVQGIGPDVGSGKVFNWFIIPSGFVAMACGGHLLLLEG